MKIKFLSIVTLLVVFSVMVSPLASAHVTVSPSTAVAGERVTFSMSVPNEEDVPVTELRLEISGEFEDLTPTVHPGWTIQKDTKDDKVVALVWSGGEIPVGQRDDFTFWAQVPTGVEELQWKAHQTYADGKVVSWNKPPTDTQSEEEGTSGPYSVTTISAEETVVKSDDAPSANNALVLAISLAALVASAYALLRKRT